MREFTLLGFAGDLTALGGEMAIVTHEALEEAAKVIQGEAKNEIGTYQGATGPFGAWPSLTPATQADRVRQGFPADEPLLRTGEMRDSIEYTVGLNEAEVGSDSDIAVYQEMGTSRIPPRSFLGGAAFRMSHHIRDVLALPVVKTLMGRGRSIDIP